MTHRYSSQTHSKYFGQASLSDLIDGTSTQQFTERRENEREKSPLMQVPIIFKFPESFSQKDFVFFAFGLKAKQRHFFPSSLPILAEPPGHRVISCHLGRRNVGRNRKQECTASGAMPSSERGKTRKKQAKSSLAAQVETETRGTAEKS